MRPSVAGHSESVSDRDVLVRLARGEQAAFESLFREHYGSLVRLAERLVRSRDLAEDTVQEVLLNLWRQRETVRVEDSLRAYLHRSVRNRALNHIRNERVRREAAPQILDDLSSERDGDSELIGEEIETAVRHAVSELPPRCREVFELSRSQGLKYAEIAEVLGISVKTVETQMGRALKTLRERLSPYLR
jgi:RNA polymerase sigma-70 factor (ECF subfamily)